MVISQSFCGRRAAGFTLIEMLIVIAIIAILAVILLSATSKVQAGANSAKCAANLRQLGVMAHLYASENDGSILPPMLYWDAGLAEYIGSKDSCGVWRCPSDKIPRSQGQKWPADPTRIAPPRSYMANGFIFNLWGQHPAYTGHPANTPAKLIQIQNPSKMWLLTELHQTQTDYDFVIGQHGASMMGGPYVPTHGANVNALMLDGHVESRPPVSDKWWGLGK